VMADEAVLHALVDDEGPPGVDRLVPRQPHEDAALGIGARRHLDTGELVGDRPSACERRSRAPEHGDQEQDGTPRHAYQHELDASDRSRAVNAVRLSGRITTPNGCHGALPDQVEKAGMTSRTKSSRPSQSNGARSARTTHSAPAAAYAPIRS